MTWEEADKVKMFIAGCKGIIKHRLECATKDTDPFLIECYTKDLAAANEALSIIEREMSKRED